MKIFLGNVSETIMGQAPPGAECNKQGKGFPFVKAGEFGVKKPLIREWTTKPLKLAKEQDVLVCVVGATSGKVNRGTDCAIGRSVAAIRAKKDLLENNYLYYFMVSWSKRLLSMSQGAAQTVITKKMLHDLEIPLPPLTTQKRIAAILDEADTLRQLNQQLIDKYNALTQSLFLEMFGDPVINPKGWEKVELKKLGQIITGSTPSSKKDNMFGGNIPFVTPGDLDKTEEYKRFVTKEGAENSRTVPEGSLFVCCIGATIGKKGIARKFSAFNQQINAIIWSKKINNYFGLHSFDWLKYEVIERAISTTLPIMKKSEFEKLKLIVPPIDLQNQFAERVKLIEEQKAQAQEALQKSEALFNSLLQRAFNGGL